MNYILAVNATGINTAPPATLEKMLLRSHQGGKASVISQPYEGKYYVFIDQISTMYAFQGVLNNLRVTHEQIQRLPDGFVKLVKAAAQAPAGSRNGIWVGDPAADRAINDCIVEMFTRATR